MGARPGGERVGLLAAARHHDQPGQPDGEDGVRCCRSCSMMITSGGCGAGSFDRLIDAAIADGAPAEEMNTFRDRANANGGLTLAVLAAEKAGWLRDTLLTTAQREIARLGEPDPTFFEGGYVSALRRLLNRQAVPDSPRPAPRVDEHRPTVGRSGPAGQPDPSTARAGTGALRRRRRALHREQTSPRPPAGGAGPGPAGHAHPRGRAGPGGATAAPYSIALAILRPRSRAATRGARRRRRRPGAGRNDPPGPARPPVTRSSGARPAGRGRRPWAGAGSWGSRPWAAAAGRPAP
jgi:hypothetical protein